MKYKNYNLMPFDADEEIAARQKYLDGINGFIEKLKLNGKLQSIDYSAPYPKCLGLPIADRENCKMTPDVIINTLHYDDMGEVRRLHIRIIDDVYGDGLLFLPKNYSEDGNFPLIFSIHGASGTPEVASAGEVDSENYNCMTRKILDMGAVVYAPFLLVGADPGLHQKIDYDYTTIERTLNKYGYSMRAFEVSHMMNAIDYFSSFPGINKNKIGMVGFSWGSIVSFMTAEADMRVDRILGSCFLESGELASRICPRKVCVECGTNDKLIIDSGVKMTNNTEHIKEQYKILQKKYKESGAEDKIMFNEHPGAHEFDSDKECKALIWTFGDYFKD